MSLWGHRDFLKLWFGQFVSEIGSRITRDGLPLAAVMVLGATPLAMSALRVVSFLPVALLGVFVGVWVDRLHRRPLMMFADVARAVLLLFIPAAAITHHLHLWMLMVVAAVTGVLTLLFDCSYQAYVPWLIDRRNLAEGNSKLGVTASAAEIIGPALTGVLVQALTAPIAILFDALSYLVSAFSLWRIAGKERALESGEPASHRIRDWRKEVVEGFEAILSNRVLLGLAGAVLTLGFATSILGVLYTLYAIKTLHMSALLFGVMVMVGGVGSLIGAFLCNILVRRFGLGRVIITMLFLYGAVSSLIPLASGTLARAATFMMLAQLFGDMTGVIYEILDVTIRQSVTSDERLGRVNSTIRTAEVTLTAIGSVLGGLFAQTAGIRATMGGAVCVMLCATLWLVFSPIRTMKSIPEGGDAANESLAASGLS